MVWAVLVALALPAAHSPVDAKITQKYLVPLCLDGQTVKPGVRRWHLPPGLHTFSFTMRNDPRHGVPGAAADPGIATVEGILEEGHHYEVEVRASPSAFSRRVWARGEWKPVLRDRSGNRISSGDPTWQSIACAP
jgi:hypothetical protein